MNKIVKNAFSIAEILISLTIVSIVASMGFSIAKKGIADAYQGYFYTGYVGLDTALKIAKNDVYDSPISKFANLQEYDKPNKFKEHFI